MEGRVCALTWISTSAFNRGVTARGRKEGHPRRTIRATTSLIAVMLLVAMPALAEGEFIIDGMVFGLPEARVFVEDYDGPPGVGDTLTQRGVGAGSPVLEGGEG